MKFGGSSLASAERIRHVASIIQAYKHENPLVVLSAMGDTTDFLLEAANNAVLGKVDISTIEQLHEQTVQDLSLGIQAVTEVNVLLAELKTLLTGISMLKELTKRTRDYLVSFGERLSVRIMAAYLYTEGVSAKYMDAWDAGFITDSQFMAAELLEETEDNIRSAFASYQDGKDTAIPIVTGFIAKDKNGYITTLGRGGSDLTATMLGAALRVKEIQTWKDVDGILTADPRIVKKARLVPAVSYEEAAELAYFGAQVLHPRSMLPCRKAGVPVRVKNSYNRESQGTIIQETHTQPPLPVRAITSVSDITLVDIVSTRMLGASGFLAHIFNIFLKWDISVDVVATSEVSVSLTVNTHAFVNEGKCFTDLITDLQKVAEINVKQDKAIVTLICDAEHSSNIISQAFSVLTAQNINPDMISQGASKVNISLVCDNKDVKHIVKSLHKTFFEF